MTRTQDRCREQVFCGQSAISADDEPAAPNSQAQCCVSQGVPCSSPCHEHLLAHVCNSCHWASDCVNLGPPIQLLSCLQAVNEHNAARLPLLLSTKLLPDMDAAAAQMLQAHQAASKDKELAMQVSELTVHPVLQHSSVHCELAAPSGGFKNSQSLCLDG